MLNMARLIFSRAAHHTIIYCFTLFLQVIICNNFIYIEDTFFLKRVLFSFVIIIAIVMLVFIHFSHLYAYSKLLRIIIPAIQATSHPLMQLVSQDGSNHLYISTSGQDCQLRRLTGGVHTYPDLVRFSIICCCVRRPTTKAGKKYLVSIRWWGAEKLDGKCEYPVAVFECGF